jgi:hypothetical protein
MALRLGGGFAAERQGVRRTPRHSEEITMSFAEAKEEFDRTIGNAIISYRYFIRTLPPEGFFASGNSVTLNGKEFERYEQALAMFHELGAVFFCRMEASNRTQNGVRPYI